MANEAELIERARRGDKQALSQLVALTKDLVFNLAVRMLGNPADAEDAAQEILIRVVTGLATFRGESAFRTWVYKVASNHLLTARKRRAEESARSLDELGQMLAEGMSAGDPPVEDQILLKEAKLACTSNMLLGLDRDHRLAFILGEILELSADEGAQVLEISSDAFRKRLSRARERMGAFAAKTCGLVDAANSCRCGTQMAWHIRLGHFDPQKRAFTVLPLQPSSVEANLDAVEGMRRALALFRGHPSYAAPAAVADGLRQLIESTKTDLFS